MNRKLLLIASFALLLLLFLPPPQGLSAAGWRAVVLFLVVIALWSTEAVSLPVAAILAVLLQPVLSIQSAPQALSAFATSSVFLILAGFLLAAGLMKSGLDRRIAYSVIRRSRNSSIALLGIIFATCLLSMIMTNTATVLLMIPIILTLAEKVRLNKKAFLLGTAYAANIGGVGLLIGTPPNIIASEALGWSFLDWACIGLPFALVMLPLLYLSLVIVYRPHKRITKGMVSKLEDLGPLSSKEKKTAGVILFTLALWVSSPLHNIPAAIVGLIGGFLMFLLVYDWEFFQRKTNWGAIFLIGGAISMANALSETGAASWMSQGFLSFTGFTDPFLLTIGFALFTMGITQFIQNTATAGMVVPILAGLSASLGNTPGLIVIPVIASSMTFLMPPGTAPNAIIHGTGFVSVRDMFRTGIIPTLFAILVLTVFTIIFF